MAPDSIDFAGVHIWPDLWTVSPFRLTSTSFAVHHLLVEPNTELNMHVDSILGMQLWARQHVACIHGNHRHVGKNQSIGYAAYCMPRTALYVSCTWPCDMIMLLLLVVPICRAYLQSLQVMVSDVPEADTCIRCEPLLLYF